ncbi:DNA recombination protein RmuC [Tepidicaulis sp. LMO-SS28]|uniref:DNA recombination protein RmuC n=1 Tax=Tepidicaulis sp. LMO-SS28 TaxID=3447455 RepID=UPI003EE06DA8
MDSVSILPFVLLGAALALLAAAGIAYALIRRRNGDGADLKAAMETELTRLTQSQSELTGRLQSLAESQRATQESLTRALNERLDLVSQRMGQSLSESSEKTQASLTQLQERLALIDQAQKNLNELSTQVVGLQDILANKQARGAFGEIQLNDIVVNALPPNAYAFQATLKTGARADCLVHLPNPPGSIVIDAKFPLDGYRALRNAGDAAAQKQAASQFRRDVQKHVKDIAEKYILPGETADSALMFLPSEAVYAELHANFADVVDHSFRQKVWIVSPTTLMATLNTVRAVLKDAEMREHAHIIQREVGKMLKDVERLDTRVDSLKKHFSQAEKDIKDIETSTQKITRKGEQIAEVELEETKGASLEDARPARSAERQSGFLLGE